MMKNLDKIEILVIMFMMMGISGMAFGSRVSSSLISHLKLYEGLRLTRYLDVGGLPTIGYGHLIKVGDSVPQRISKSYAENLLRQDALVASLAVEAAITVDLSTMERDALTSLVFNIGIGAFRRSTLRKLLNRGEYYNASKQFFVWNKVNGVINQGLVNRREGEYKMFVKGMTSKGRVK